MEYIRAEHIRVRASLVVLVIDDFTGKVISDGSVIVSIADGSKPIRKADGYYVFVNVNQQQIHLTVSADYYITEKRIIDMTAIDRVAPVVKIRVKPNRNYPLQKSMTAIYGKAEPHSEIRILCDNIQKYYRLLYDYDPEKNKREISIFNPDKTDLDGKLLLIKDKEETDGELIRIVDTKSREDNLYLLDKEAETGYKKLGTRLLPIFTHTCDESGEFFITLYNTGVQELSCQCEMLGSTNVKQSVTVESGKSSRLDFI